MFATYSIPTCARLVVQLRDVWILDILSASTLYTRTAIIFDPDADTRILDVLFSLHARDRHTRANVIGLAESKGVITFWYGDSTTIDYSRRSLIDAANAVLFPYDKWVVNPPIIAPMLRDGTLDRDKLALSDPLRDVPERYKLGLVRS